MNFTTGRAFKGAANSSGWRCRLALEEAGAHYIDIARSSGDGGIGEEALLAFLERDDVSCPPFAPPFLKDGDVLIGQTASILL